MAWAQAKRADEVDVGDVLSDGRTIDVVTPSGTRWQDIEIDGVVTRYRNDFVFSMEAQSDWLAVALRRLTQSVVPNVADETLSVVAAVKAEYGIG